jgi:hypothetical protein
MELICTGIQLSRRQRHLLKLPDVWTAGYGYPSYVSGVITLLKYLVDTGTVERIEFADGTVWGA